MIDVKKPIPRIMTTVNAQLQCNELYIVSGETRFCDEIIDCKAMAWIRNSSFLMGPAIPCTKLL
jgi:hypothetical protein